MCGVIGVFAPGEDVARMCYFGLHALQHRGQESAGIAVGDGSTVTAVKNLGLVSQIFRESDLKAMPGQVAIGHARYSTTGGSTSWENAQPHLSSIDRQLIALAHNGNLVNTAALRDGLIDEGVRLRSDSDSEAIAALVGAFTQQTNHIRDGIARTMELIRGAYAVVLITENALYAFRDPLGIRPLVLGELVEVSEGGRSCSLAPGHGWVVASETTGLDILGARFVREVAPGEILRIDAQGLASCNVADAAAKGEGVRPGALARCIFEYVYFARPDSVVDGRSMYECRHRMGELLAQHAPVRADVVIGVPDSGTPAAIGYARASGIPYGDGLAKNRYVGRTFIQPGQSLRQRGIRLKLNPMKHAIEGKRVVVVDDSIVRGNTTRALVGMLREAGATEVHLRVTSPPVAWPCFLGIDTPTRTELIASRADVEEIREHVGADTLVYLRREDMVAATNRPADEFCCACFDGDYPLDVSANLAQMA
ncbi:MAG: amidophosphoribosyltransferase [Actinomycetes bacterium]|jgi:amidophosphoribosyltransferase|nr:amidophosphoribosyltransferase [Actinomycetes bacterium]